MKYTPEKIQAHEIKDETLESGDMSKKVIHVNAGAPTKTNDTGEGYNQGTIWVDSTNGDMYICTAHTAEDATWHNMDGDDINNVSYQGTNTSFGIGCRTAPGSPNDSDVVDKFSLSSDANASDATEAVAASPGYSTANMQASEAKSLILGRSSNNDIGIFNLATEAISDSGNELAVNNGGGGGTNQSTTHYFHYKDGPAGTNIYTGAFSSPYAASDTGDEATAGGYSSATFGDKTYMFSTAGYLGPPGAQHNQIERMSKTSPHTGTDVANAVRDDRGQTGGSASTTHGYTFGGEPDISDIEKFQMSATSDASDVAELATNTNGGCVGEQASSPSSGYAIGGSNPSPAGINVIQKYSFSADQDATDVGDLSQARYGIGHAYY